MSDFSYTFAQHGPSIPFSFMKNRKEIKLQSSSSFILVFSYIRLSVTFKLTDTTKNE
jgi:hypothetical protein